MQSKKGTVVSMRQQLLAELKAFGILFPIPKANIE
jgi:hypothetical protein